jgi:branched-chain amino acid aminotransferase
MNKKGKVWLNGELIPWEKATVHIMSHGFSRGSAIFEVFGVHPLNDGPAIFRLDLHLKRLFRTAAVLGMEIAQSQKELEKAVSQVVRANRIASGFVKIIAYYGQEAFATLVPDAKLDMSIFALSIEAALGLKGNKPIRACISKWRKTHPETVPPETKAAANYLNGMLARQDAIRRGFDVGLMLDTQGFVAEGSVESVFMVKDGVLMTPPLGRVLASVSRQSVLEVARASGVTAVEAAIRSEDLRGADEIFTSSTTGKVLPVKRLDDRTLKAPGPVSRRLMRDLDLICAGRDDRFKHWLTLL